MKEGGKEGNGPATGDFPGDPDYQPPAPLPPAIPETRPFNGFAIASLVLGLVAPLSMGILGIPGLVCGIIALNQCVDRDERGGGTVLVAIVLNLLSIGLLVIVITMLRQL